MYIVLSKLELECDVDIGYLHPSFIVAFSLFLSLVFMYLSLSPSFTWLQFCTVHID